MNSHVHFHARFGGEELEANGALVLALDRLRMGLQMRQTQRFRDESFVALAAFVGLVPEVAILVVDQPLFCFECEIAHRALERLLFVVGFQVDGQVALDLEPFAANVAGEFEFAGVLRLVLQQADFRAKLLAAAVVRALERRLLRVRSLVFPQFVVGAEALSAIVANFGLFLADRGRCDWLAGRLLDGLGLSWLVAHLIGLFGTRQCFEAFGRTQNSLFEVRNGDENVLILWEGERRIKACCFIGRGESNLRRSRQPRKSSRTCRALCRAVTLNRSSESLSVRLC